MLSGFRHKILSGVQTTEAQLYIYIFLQKEYLMNLQENKNGQNAVICISES